MCSWGTYCVCKCLQRVLCTVAFSYGSQAQGRRTIMRLNGANGTELAIAVGLISLLMFPARSTTQTGGTFGMAQASGLQCNGTRLLDPFKGSLAGPSLPAGLLPID